MFELHEKYTKGEMINSPKNVLSCLENIKSKDRECFVCLHLNTIRKIISIETVFIGTLDSCVIHPREIFKGAILNSASSIIIAHNHPSGDCNPSEEDRKLTKGLVLAGKLMGIPVIDHIIVTQNDYYSFIDNDEISLQ